MYTNIFTILHEAASSKLELENGIVIAVPIPKDESANTSHIQNAIEAALLQAK